MKKKSASKSKGSSSRTEPTMQIIKAAEKGKKKK